MICSPTTFWAERTRRRRKWNLNPSGDLMSEWDFLWGLTGQALEDAMTSGATYEEWAYIEREIDRELVAGHTTNVFVFADGENVSAKLHEQINAEVRHLVDAWSAKVYARQKDPATQGWHAVAQDSNGELKEIRLFGGPEKNKVDKKIIKDMRSVVSNCAPAETTIFLVTSDSDFGPAVSELRSKGVKVIGLGEEKSPERLRKRFDRFIELYRPEDGTEDEEGDGAYDHIPPPSWFKGGSDAYRYG